ncbi:unnamed protein product [Mytilus edulis]|uniref:Reverse transcriptase domain-containing protein n=1 Tax=Mytilus edulis TaxID=6550 RepID=A0A8S3USS1_MYTED|nr:unnamed protein product [Mytilus edulis]
MNLNDIKGFLINFDQEKAFDKIKHEFLIKVLKKMNLPVEFIRWIKILYKDIKSKIQVNGQLTEEILITRSVRQGCPLSMNLYALAIETLASSIRKNKNIKGINIPNLKDPIKLFQHADDCTTITTDIKDYYLFMNEFEKFGKASGAKINKNKTEILNICNAPEEDTCLKLLTKESVKTLGIWFGKESQSKSWLPIIHSIKNTVEKWENRKLNFKHKLIVINTYIISKILFVARVVSPLPEYLTQINRYIYTFFWEGITRNI